MNNIMISCSVWALEALIYKLERDVGLSSFSVKVMHRKNGVSG